MQTDLGFLKIYLSADANLSSVYREDCALSFFFFKCVKEMHLVIQSVDVMWHYLTLNQKYFTVGKKTGAKNIWPVWQKIVLILRSHKCTVNYTISVMEVFDMLCEQKADYKRSRKTYW